MASGGAGSGMSDKVHVSNHPVMQHKLSILRNKATKPNQFRRLLRELTVHLGYETTADLTVHDVPIETPVASGTGGELTERVALVPILRAGLGMSDTMQDLLPTAHVHHIGMYRDASSLVPVLYYNRLPAEVDCDLAIVLEPMIATAGTINACLSILKDWGVKRIKVLSIIAAASGLAALHKAHPDVDVYVAAVDDALTEAGYIMPGLGDVGDRLFKTPHDKPDLEVTGAASDMAHGTPKRMDGSPTASGAGSKRSRGGK
mmetsp:Transcript_115287/g.320616  ORF Transcript_115287/g.320616 Transcript_115287/m.320616 type:complete len:260 (-) Transcript_115287:41-820(-)